MTQSSQKRTVHHTDAIEWLNEQPLLRGCSIVTSLPDISEFPKMNMEEWKEWFVDAAALVMSKCPDEGIAIFYQTDLKKDGVWIDKSFLCQKAAEFVGFELVAHKIIARAPAGINTQDKPGYSHLICFSKTPRLDLAKSFEDILPEAGETTWARGMGAKACMLACQMVLDHTETRAVVDPFCGHGTILAIANYLNLDAIGVEHKLKYSKKAQELSFEDLSDA